MSWQPDEFADDPADFPQPERADFELTVRAGQGAQGATGLAVTADDFAHVRNWLRGLILGLDGQLPPGWRIEIAENAPVGSSALFRGNPGRAPAAPPEQPPDRLEQIEVGVCHCGRPIRRESELDSWYHLEPCIDPEPVP